MGLFDGLINLFTGVYTAERAEENFDKQIAYQEDAQRLQNEANFRLTREYNNAQKQLAQSQNEYNTQMWEKQNAYNSPQATMHRLVEAGINPRAYQQIGQFANASAPTPAVTPEQRMAEYMEPKLVSEALRAQKLELRNAVKEQRLRAIQLTSDTILEYRKQAELKRHNQATELSSIVRNTETTRHNEAVEAAKHVELMFKDSEFRYALAKAGVTRNDDGTFNIPESDIRIDQKHKIQLIDNLEKAGFKLQTENDYLKVKQDLEVIKTGNAVLDNLIKLISKIL